MVTGEEPWSMLCGLGPQMPARDMDGVGPRQAVLQLQWMPFERIECTVYLLDAMITEVPPDSNDNTWEHQTY